jgi:hypothetical protein
MTYKNLPDEDINSMLQRDSSGKTLSVLTHALSKSEHDIRALLKGKSSPENFRKLNFLLGALLSAEAVVVKIWDSHHARKP